MQQALATEHVQHPVVQYLNTLTSDKSKQTMLSALKAVLAVALGQETADVEPAQVYEFPWPQVDAGRMKALRAALLDRYSSSHAAKCLAAVRGVLGACFDAELIDAGELMRIERVQGVQVKRDQRTGRKLSDGEIRALTEVCAADPSPAGIRDEAILAVGVTQGPRVSEVAAFELADYDPESGDLLIRDGKGGKPRTIRVNNGAKAALDDWIDCRGQEPGALFVPINKGGRLTIRHMSTAALGGILKKRSRQAGVKPFTFHDLRRTFITNDIALNGIRNAQIIAGHESPETTAKYDRGELEEALAASGRHHWPRLRSIA